MKRPLCFPVMDGRAVFLCAAIEFSTPHGAGCACSRTDAKYAFTAEEFKREMQGIHTTTATEGSLNECPMAYKAPSRILEFIGETIYTLFSWCMSVLSLFAKEF